MNGKELRKQIRNSGKPIATIAAESGIKEATIYTLYKKEEVEEHYLTNLKKAGIELEKTSKNSTPSDFDKQTIEHQKEVIKMLRDQVEILKDQILMQDYLLAKDKGIAFKKHETHKAREPKNAG